MRSFYPERAKPLPADAKKVFTGNIFSVWQWEQRQYDGSTKTYERLSRSDTAHTIGILPDGRILLNQDEQPDREPVITPAGGQVEVGESPEAAARREFLEETGYAIGTLIPWHTYRPSVKVAWTVHAFIGRDLKKIAELNPDGGEKLTPLTFTFDEFLQLGHNPQMRDMVIRIILLQALLDPKMKEELKKQLYG